MIKWSSQSLIFFYGFTRPNHIFTKKKSEQERSKHVLSWFDSQSMHKRRRCIDVRLKGCLCALVSLPITRVIDSIRRKIGWDSLQSLMLLMHPSFLWSFVWYFWLIEPDELRRDSPREVTKRNSDQNKKHCRLNEWMETEWVSEPQNYRFSGLSPWHAI